MRTGVEGEEKRTGENKTYRLGKYREENTGKDIKWETTEGR